MWEVAVVYMESSPGWIQIPTSDANHVFQFRNATMTIFPNGNWECVTPVRGRQQVSRGSLNGLEKFLQDFAAVNL
jgi:hypothetical protein